MKPIIKSVADKTTEYLLSLPNGTNITMYQAASIVVPDELAQMEFMDLFALFDAVLESIKKTDVVLDMSKHEDADGGVPFNEDFYVYHKCLQKAQIISDLIVYGPSPKIGDPVKQHLTISSTGRVWFTERVYGPLDNNYRYPTGRKIQLSIGRECAAAILSKLDDYANSKVPSFDDFAKDCGSWKLILTGLDGNKTEVFCSLDVGAFVGDDDMTDFIRARVPIDKFAAFRGPR